MNALDLKELLARSENETLDFKRDQYPFEGATDQEKAKVLKDILAITNSCKECDGHIVIGVEEENGRAKRVGGAKTTLRDSDLQQFVNSKLNRPVTFIVEVVDHDGVSVTVIRITKPQGCPYYLKEEFGKLKKNAVYIRRGSSTFEMTPDEITEMVRGDIAALREADKRSEEQRRKDRFWKNFEPFITELIGKVQVLRGTTFQYVHDNVFAYRLPLDELAAMRKAADDLDLDAELRRNIKVMWQHAKVIEENIDKGAEFIRKNQSNFSCEVNTLIELTFKMKSKYVS